MIVRGTCSSNSPVPIRIYIICRFGYKKNKRKIDNLLLYSYFTLFSRFLLRSPLFFFYHFVDELADYILYLVAILDYDNNLSYHDSDQFLEFISSFAVVYRIFSKVTMEKNCKLHYILRVSGISRQLSPLGHF